MNTNTKTESGWSTSAASAKLGGEGGTIGGSNVGAILGVSKYGDPNEAIRT